MRPSRWRPRRWATVREAFRCCGADGDSRRRGSGPDAGRTRHSQSAADEHGARRRTGHAAARAATLARFLDYVASKPKVWVATREEIARHWMKVHPAKR